MPFVETRGARLHFEERGSGEQTVVFSHSYLVDHHHFDPQIEALAKRYRVVAYDHRDHGPSTTTSNTYGFQDLVDDTLAVIEHTEAAPCHFVGLSTGGFIGVRLGIHHRTKLRSLTLMDTSADVERNVLKYQAMFAVLRTVGKGPLWSQVMKTMLGRTTLKKRKALAKEWRKRIASQPVDHIIRFGNAIFERDDVRGQLSEVNTPTLVVVGEEDVPLPPARAKDIAEAIPGAELVQIPQAGHLCTVEQPEAVNAALLPFIDAHSS